MTETSEPGPGQHGFDVEGGIGDGADAALQSWAGYEWKSFCRPREGSMANISQYGAFGACKTGFAAAWAGPAPSEALQAANARTYAMAVAGVAQKMHFNVTSKAFRLEWIVSSQVAPTEIFAWKHNYPGGLFIEATTTVGKIEWRYDEQTSRVLVWVRGDAIAGAHVALDMTTVHH